MQYCRSVWLLTCLGCLHRRTRSITNEWSPGCSSICCCTASIRDIWVSLTIWSAQRSSWRPLGRRHDGGGVEARMSMAWVPGCRRQMCPNALSCSLQIVVVRGGCPERVRCGWVLRRSWHSRKYQRTPTMRRRAFVLKASRRFCWALVSVHEAELQVIIEIMSQL